MSVPSVKEQRLALQRQRDELNESLNAIAYPNTLPAEVLSYIFALHSALVIKDEAASREKRNAERVRIAHVCRRWRAVAVESAELWSNLLFTSAEIVPLMLIRSKTAPLTITMRQVDTRLHEPLRDILSSQRHRLRSVEITDIVEPREFGFKLAVPMPSLEKLVLKIRNQSYNANPIVLPFVPDHMLQGSPPILRHLEIVDFTIQNFKTLPLVPSLTYLHLGTRLHDLDGPSAEALLSTLQQLPRLETLVLARYLPADVYPSHTTNSPIEFPSLRSVSISSGYIDYLHNLLHAIRIPNASLEVAFTEKIYHIESLGAFLPTLATAQKLTKEQPPLQALTIKNVWLEGECTMYNFSFSSDSAGLASCPWISVGYTKQSQLHPRLFLGELAMSFMNWRSLKSLHVGAQWTIGREEWEIFGLLPELSAIAFSCNADIEGFINLLNEASTLGRMGVKHPQARAFPLFPALCSLSVEGMDLVEESEYRDILVSALNKRTGPHRVHTLKVTFNDEGFSQEDIDFLRTSVPGLQVEWEQDEEISERDTDDEWDTEKSAEEEG